MLNGRFVSRFFTSSTPQKRPSPRTSPIEGCDFLQSPQFLADIGPISRARSTSFKPLHLSDGRHGRRQRHRMRFVRVPMREEMIVEEGRDAAL